MAKDQSLAEKSSEELLKYQKKVNLLTGIVVGAFAILLGLAIQAWINDGRSVLIVLPFALLPIGVIFIKKIQEIKTELKSRR